MLNMVPIKEGDKTMYVLSNGKQYNSKLLPEEFLKRYNRLVTLIFLIEKI